MEARAWLKEIKKSIEILSIAENQKTVFATYLLKGEANHWWESKKNLEGDGVVTCERFSLLFLEKYFPEIYGDPDGNKVSRVITRNHDCGRG